MEAPDATAVRAGEELNAAALCGYLRGKVEGVGDRLEIEQFPGGHSNLTYLLRSGEREYVLRRPPLGPVAPKAHDMAREFRILRAISPCFPPAPAVYLVCEDPAVIGAPFFVMERRRGVVIRREVPLPLRGHDRLPARASEAFVQCLAQLHSIDIERHGLASLGRPDGFLERQVRGWSERWLRAKTHDLPEMENLSRWLAAKRPAEQAPAIVHNDFKLDNVMLDEQDCGKIVAVLDWELTTVGDPMVDVGTVLSYWSEPGDPEMRREAISPITAQPGWFSRREFLQRYQSLTGRDLSDVTYFEVFGLFKLAVILQQIYYRFHAGQTSDERFRDFHLRVKGLAEAATLVVETPR
jgi:aminoglycoside phosphotransferase (APT) family kinase protein